MYKLFKKKSEIKVRCSETTVIENVKGANLTGHNGEN